MPFEKDPDEIGALWIRSGSKGDFLSGTINGQDVICFRSKSSNPKAPAWHVKKSKPKEDMPVREPHNANAKPVGDIEF